jgi:hypothetical protein
MKSGISTASGPSRDAAGVLLMCLVAIAIAAGGCTSKIVMMPTPVIFQGGRIDLFKDTPADKQGNTLDVLYATERGGRGPADKRDYNNDMSKTLRLGKATVQFGGADTTGQQLGDAALAETRKTDIRGRV